MIVDPCNFLDFTKLVWPILEQLKMWGILKFKPHWTMAPIFGSCKNAVRFLKPLAMQMKWLCQVWFLGEHNCNWNKSSNTSLEPFCLQFKFKSNGPKTIWQLKSSHEIINSSTMPSIKVNRQSTISWWFTLFLLGCYSCRMVYDE